MGSAGICTTNLLVEHIPQHKVSVELLRQMMLKPHFADEAYTTRGDAVRRRAKMGREWEQWVAGRGRKREGVRTSG